MSGRREKITAGLNLSGPGLEIGAAYNPTLTRQEGYDVSVLDYLSREDLRKKYHSTPGVDLDRIQPVDYIWQGGSYADLVGGKKFDWIIASHVIEHVVDVVSFINECDAILTDGGILSMAIPDKRYMFDHYRPPTGLGEIVDAHVGPSSRTTPGRVAEFFASASLMNGKITWHETEIGIPAFAHSFDFAASCYKGILENGTFHDIHRWVYTPHSFRWIMADLYQMGCIRLREMGFWPTMEYEFFCQLSARGAGPSLDRITLANLALREAGT